MLVYWKRKLTNQQGLIQGRFFSPLISDNNSKSHPISFMEVQGSVGVTSSQHCSVSTWNFLWQGRV